MANRIDVMISSTRKDLMPHRQAVRDVIVKAGMYPLGMENDSAVEHSNDVKYSLNMVAECEIYLLILGFRYGHRPDHDNPNNLSITHLEYEEAKKLGKPILAFLMAEDHPIIAAHKDDGDNLVSIMNFRDQVAGVDKQIVGFFRSVEDFREQALDSLHKAKARMEGKAPAELSEGELPPGSRVNFARNRLFTGREQDLKQLAEALLHSNGASPTVIVGAVGMGGLGKTQLAAEFCYRYGRFFTGVHWIQAPVDTPLQHGEPHPPTPGKPLSERRGVWGEVEKGSLREQMDSALRAEIAACGALMNLPNFPADNLEAQVTLTLQAWQKGKHLLILDNLEDEAILREWVRQLPNARILLTARNMHWDKGLVKMHELDKLSVEESRALLRKLAGHLNESPDADLDALAERVGYLPLALNLMGRYLDDTSLSPAAYLEALKAHPNLLEAEAFRGWVEAMPTAHHRDVAATFALSWAQLGDSDIDTLAKKLFRACAYARPNTPIPDAWLSWAVLDEETPGSRYYKARRRLLETGLLTRPTTELSIHPLLNAYALALDSAEAEASRAVDPDGETIGDSDQTRQ
jgi:hypothetical protein